MNQSKINVTVDTWVKINSQSSYEVTADERAIYYMIKDTIPLDNEVKLLLGLNKKIDTSFITGNIWAKAINTNCAVTIIE